ncbi:hypothetical protein [Paenibacillus cymbidii]|uniref:hypothetical protein n=1 Tax=Paenibacillus cymbidii TaxID=1639034 RepID=UPI001F17E239|nr:hypothetical protein [Paenibacillus cymbidii]
MHADCTVYGRVEMLKLPERTRADAVLVKPVSRIDLQRALQALALHEPSRLAVAEAEAAAFEERVPGLAAMFLWQKTTKSTG